MGLVLRGEASGVKVEPLGLGQVPLESLEGSLTPLPCSRLSMTQEEYPQQTQNLPEP